MLVVFVVWFLGSVGFCFEVVVWVFWSVGFCFEVVVGGFGFVGMVSMVVTVFFPLDIRPPLFMV